jgi:hypothetical protein
MNVVLEVSAVVLKALAAEFGTASSAPTRRGMGWRTRR